MPQMTRAALLAILLGATPTLAQELPARAPADPPAADAPVPTTVTPSAAPPAGAPPAAPVLDPATAARLEFLESKVNALEAKLAERDRTAPPPDFRRGSPEFRQPAAGYSFRLTGEIQYDVGYVSNPNDAVSTVNLGFNSRARRIIIGAAGNIPGDLRYHVEFNFTGQAVDYEDVIIAWEPKDRPFQATLGFHYPFVSLDILTSNKLTSFVERSQINDALGQNGRRIGASFQLFNKAGDLRFQAGVFNADINGGFANTNWLGSTRLVWSPKFDWGQLHLAGNYQYRRFPVQAQGFNYRARPFTQTTDVRFVGTAPASAAGAGGGGVAARGDQIFGLEAAGIFGPVHIVGEAYRVKVDGLRPDDLLGPGRVPAGVRLLADPEFFSAYGEIGWWLTGETRGYSRGRFDRTRMKHRVDQGGLGGLQLVGRVDWLDLSDRVGGSGPGIVDGVLNGGKQLGYLAALNWWPTDYLRFTAQYTRAGITGGPAAGQVPVGGSLFDRDYGVNVFVLRSQVDF